MVATIHGEKTIKLELKIYTFQSTVLQIFNFSIDLIESMIIYSKFNKTYFYFNTDNIIVDPTITHG